MWNLDFTKMKSPFLLVHFRSSGAVFILCVFLTRISNESEITFLTSLGVNFIRPC